METEPITTEQKIIRAARKIFSQKGYAATTTRDIAEEAGTNLALLNYYFGSKENLFKNIVKEKMGLLLGAIGPVLSDENIPLEEKISAITQNYTNLLLENEELPIFLLNELSINKEPFADLIQNTRKIVQPVLEKQLKERGINISVPDLIINVLGMIIFPFVAKPLVTSSGIVKEDEFAGFVTARKEKILEWMLKIIG